MGLALKLATEVAPATEVPDEERPRSRNESFADLVQRLSRQSVSKHFDAYEDVPWDDPTMRIDSNDPRWELWPESTPLGATAWYRSQPAAVRSRIGLHVRTSRMKVGLQFENILQRGLLAFALTLPDRSPEFRYAYHEVIEEGQHTLMFQEFVDRSGIDLPGPPALIRWGAGVIAALGRFCPELFFLFVLGGEDPIDHMQRSCVRAGGAHPLLHRIMQIHITEEARHLCFARTWLEQHVPGLGRVRRLLLQLGAPLVLAVMAVMMLRPSESMIRRFAIPRDVFDEAYTKNPRHKESVLDSFAKTRALCERLGILTSRTRPLWRRLGLLPA